MDTPTWYLVVQTLANVAIAGTFVVYLFQLAAMRGQLDAAREASRGQNILALHNFIFDESFRRDRKVLIELEEAAKPMAAWTPDERRSAERVCAAYNLVGLLVSYGVVDFRLLEDVRYSMTKCHKAATPLLEEARRARTADLWHHFSDMVDRFRRTTS